MNLRYQIQTAIDSIIYLLVGPFTVIGTVPLLLMEIDTALGLPRWTTEVVISIGYTVMNIGAALALWCTWLMRCNGGSPIPSAPSPDIVSKGPYAIVRHPMMYSLLIVGTGELLVTGSLLMLLWIPIAIRAGMLFVSSYAEPVLIGRFGNDYLAYCQTVPRWIPKWLTKA